MDRTITSGRRFNIVPVTDAIPRNGEGSAVVLDDGRILFIYSRFTGGGGDADTADLYGGILDPQTGAISDERVFFASPDALNQMSVSLERLQDGAIGMVYIRKTSPRDDDILFSRSEDEGRTWSEPVNLSAGHDIPYIVVNNDRLRQLSSGRLLVPGALYIDRDLSKLATLACFYSDDGGQSWSLGEQVVADPSDISPPHQLAPGAETTWQDAVAAPNKLQEPGVEELADGRVLLYCRTFVGYMYQAYSSDGGDTWGRLRAATDLVSPVSPQSIRRIPDTERLLCAYNDHRHLAYGQENPSWSWRTPLSIALSDDHGDSWRTIGTIEDSSHNYCYTSITFHDEKVLFTYYESENTTTDDGEERRRNLAHLKLQVLDIAEVRGH